MKSVPLSNRLRNHGLIALISSTSIALIGQFMVSPILVFELLERGTQASRIGLFTAAVWLGILITTPFAARIVQKIGAKQALIQSLLIPSITLGAMLYSDNVLIWAALYFAAGIAMALRWIVAEACVAELAPDHQRGRIVGLNQMLIGLSFVVAPILLAWIGPLSPLAPRIALAFLLAGLLITFLIPDTGGVADKTHPSGLRAMISTVRASPLLLVAGFTAGFFELGISTMLPVYGLAIGFSSAAAALLISVSGAGSTLIMLPLGEAADRFSARYLMNACAATILIASLLLPVTSFFPALAWPLAFLWGAAGGALYTLAMIDLGHRRRGVALIAATSVLVMAYTLGGLVGPIVAGYAIEFSVRYALAAAFTLVAVLAWWGLARLWRPVGS